MKLETEPPVEGGGSEKDLHVFPDEAQGWQVRGGGSFEPEGYYDTQDEAGRRGALWSG